MERDETSENQVESTPEIPEQVRVQFEKVTAESEQTRKKWREMLSIGSIFNRDKPSTSRQDASKGIGFAPLSNHLEELNAKSAELDDAIKKAKQKAKEKNVDANELRQLTEEIKVKEAEFMEARKKADPYSQLTDREAIMVRTLNELKSKTAEMDEAIWKIQARRISIEKEIQALKRENAALAKEETELSIAVKQTRKKENKITNNFYEISNKAKDIEKAREAAAKKLAKEQLRQEKEERINAKQRDRERLIREAKEQNEFLAKQLKELKAKEAKLDEDIRLTKQKLKKGFV